MTNLKEFKEGVLIVAKCNVNKTGKTYIFEDKEVLIVAKCNVNMGVLEGIVISTKY